MSKKSHRYGHWTRRWFALKLNESTNETTLTHWYDNRKRVVKGILVLDHSSQVFGITSDGLHSHSFKVLVKGTTVTLDAESSQQRMRWILAIESVVLDMIEISKSTESTTATTVSTTTTTISSSKQSLHQPPSTVVIESPIMLAKYRRDSKFTSGTITTTVRMNEQLNDDQITPEPAQSNISHITNPVSSSESIATTNSPIRTKVGVIDDNNTTSPFSRHTQLGPIVSKATEITLYAHAEKLLKAWMTDDQQTFMTLVTDGMFLRYNGSLVL